MKLTREQSVAVDRGEAVRTTDETGRELVVLRADVFDRIRTVIYDDGQWTSDEMARLAWEAGKSIGWDDPDMQAYDDYETHRP